MNDISKFYSTIYNLSYITRYSNVPRIKNESVAEHSFFVAAIVIELYESYEFDLGKALAMAIVHDWTESYVDDVTVVTKRMFPAIGTAIAKAELQVADTAFSKHAASIWHEFHASPYTVEQLIVKYADVLQCSQYSKNEIALGNHGYMKEVYDSSVKRANKLKGELLNYARH